MLEVTESDFPSLSCSVNSCLGLSTSACARASRVAAASAGVAARVCAVSSSSAVSAVAHAHASTLHGAHNSWSDTVRVQGPTGTRRVKGGVSGLAEDLRPVSEVEAGVNFRPAGGVRGQVAGSIPRRQPGTGTRRCQGRWEVPGIQFVSPGYGLDIRQSMGWTKVCETARPGIWVLKGIARICMFPANLDHLRVEWMKRGSYKTARARLSVNISMDVEQQADHKLITPSGMGLLGLWRRVAPFLLLGCEPEPVRWSRIIYSLA